MLWAGGGNNPLPLTLPGSERERGLNQPPAINQSQDHQIRNPTTPNYVTNSLCPNGKLFIAELPS